MSFIVRDGIGRGLHRGGRLLPVHRQSMVGWSSSWRALCGELVMAARHCPCGPLDDNLWVVSLDDALERDGV